MAGGCKHGVAVPRDGGDGGRVVGLRAVGSQVGEGELPGGVGAAGDGGDFVEVERKDPVCCGGFHALA